MSLKKVTAIIQERRLNAVLNALRDAGITSITISRARGLGEYVNNYSPNSTARYSRVEVIMDPERSKLAAELIMEVAHTGLAGDGIVSIVNVEMLYRIRDKKTLCCDDEGIL